MNNVSKLQSMTFQEEALWELKNERKRANQNRKTFWIQVEFADGTKRNYQLAKDLQKAMWQHVKTHHNDWQKIILRALINVPVSNYDAQGNAQIRVAKVLKIWIKNKHTSRSECVTRSQFVRPKYNRFSFAKYTVMFNYLKHDYDKNSVRNINHDLRILMKVWSPNSLSKPIKSVLKNVEIVIYIWMAVLIISPLSYLLGKAESITPINLKDILFFSVLLVFFIIFLTNSFGDSNKEKNTKRNY
ncbi:hypothetical protein [uncultured Limosilactobacillus sp.]|uniref:DUF7679 family protein n=1 Tax=uncultured Limosilactobacillus sp. TaxID=2837629 RepID=UPI0025E5DEDE|nr:hypothetical protein [uncultured Limosilactobacillus sp.]